MAGKEYGRLGQKRYGGTFFEEFLPELRGKKGIEVFYEMSENDDTIGSIMTAIELLLRQVTWRVDPAGPNRADEEAAEFVEQCREDMQDTWTDTISEILSFLNYGWSFHEIVYKRRMGRSKNPTTNSRYSDGLIGWQKLPVRAQETLYEWVYDEHDNLVAMQQLPPPDYGILEIPLSKAMLFRTKSRKNNPEGRSILRNAYRSWYFKRRIQEIEGIGIERDLAGFPVLYVPKAIDIFSENPEMQRIKAELQMYVKNIRRDEMEGAVLPDNYKLELLSTGGSRQFDTNAIINRYDLRMAMTVMADFIMLGQQGAGSYALSTDKTDMFKQAICTYLDIICETFNRQGIPNLIDINGKHFEGITNYPVLVHGDVNSMDLGILGDFLQKMSSSGMLQPDDAIEDFIREVARLPEKNISDKMKVSPETEDVEEEEEDDQKAEAAKKRLGRG